MEPGCSWVPCAPFSGGSPFQRMQPRASEALKGVPRLTPSLEESQSRENTLSACADLLRDPFLHVSLFGYLSRGCSSQTHTPSPAPVRALTKCIVPPSGRRPGRGKRRNPEMLSQLPGGTGEKSGFRGHREPCALGLWPFLGV